MQTLELLQKKRDGEPLSEKEFSFLIEGYVRGEIPDYQMAALLTSIYLNSLTEPEIFSLTKSMAESGEEVDFSCISGFKADKHSTGGVGDKVSLLLVPLVASCDLVIGKLSGRGLGHTGGTIDKLESIPGFKATISKDRFIKNLRKSGLGIIEHTEQLVPADRKLYTLRNETATVDSIPLIISSIMSKKMACHPDGLVLDIKVGSGAFLKTRQEAQELGYGCVKIGKKANLNTSALLTNMNQPLGRTIGNAIEVEEAILTARGEKKGELHHLAIELASELLVKAKSDYRLEDARQILKRKIKDGEVAEKLRAMIENQGGKARVVDDLDLLPQAAEKISLSADQSGYVHDLDALCLGRAANLLGAGREGEVGEIDPAAGIRLLKKIGDSVKEEEPFVQLQFNRARNIKKAKHLAKNAISTGTEPPQESDLVLDRIS